MENNTNNEVMPEDTSAPAEANIAAQDSSNAEPVVAFPESNSAKDPVQPPELSDEAKFKKLLEYLVAHLEWKVNKDRNFAGFSQYIEPNLNEQGELPVECSSSKSNDLDSIQDYIKDWCRFGSDRVYININAFQKPNKEYPTGWFLNWNDTGCNVKTVWHDNHIVALRVCLYLGTPNDPVYCESTVKQLGLFKEDEPNQELKKFWKEFYDMLLRDKAWHAAQETVKMTNDLQELITNNKNLILTGAPGTGKTFLAKQLACKLVGAKEANDKDPLYKDHVKFVQFHPSYDYTDFVEGLRPVSKDGQLGFEHKDGIFKKLCKDALKAQNKAKQDRVEAPAFVMIIDEINRGQVSKIFGELFFALDPDYRGKEGKVETQYQNMVTDEDFYVPENVYVIGTMNDIDHSLEPLDFAFRRRFAWCEITAEERFKGMFNGDEPFKSAPEFVNKVKPYFDRLNDKIEKDPGFGAAYQVGPAYFLKLKNFIKDNPDLNAANEDQVKGWMEQLWEFHLKPLLAEYLKGNSDTNLDIEKLHNAYLDVKSKEGTNQSGEQAGGAQG